MAGVSYMHSTDGSLRGMLSYERRYRHGHRAPPHHGQRELQADHQPRRRAGRPGVRLRDHRRSGRRRDRAGVALRHGALPDPQPRLERVGGSGAPAGARLRPGRADQPGPARRDHGDGRPMSAHALDASRDRVLKTGTDGGIVLAHATAVRAVAAWTLAPAPRDPARQVEAVMTDELFSRLTDAHPAPLTAPAGVGRYTYTPRKALRRVLDHALDHLNQIDQWIAWQRHGTVPTPTDGWVPSTVTLADDRLPLTAADLDAWLWRVDQAVRLVAQRAAGLSEAELDWLPPDGGWPLRRVLHHLARSERLYAAALDEALLDAEPSGRYGEACRRLDDELRAVAARGHDPSIVYAGLYGVLQTPRSEEHTSELQSPCNLVCRLLLEKKKKKKKQSFADKNKKKTDTNK